ncbi:pyridoxal-phosphate dependent enzyme [bacterium]|nr:MAG: pyridoxal-phosphate dependent enzyme [bacterium]
MFGEDEVSRLDIADVRAAYDRIARYLPETPLVQHPAFARALGCDAWLKLESAQPTGAFKVRGGVNWMAVNVEQVRERGVVTASTGNHGQSIAYAAALYGVPAVIYAPAGANPFKVRAMEAMGAEVRLEGQDFQASVAVAERAAQEEGRRFISSGDEPLLIAGVATMALEAFARRSFDVLIVPVGGGSNAAGAALVAKALSAQTRVIAVCSAQAPAAHDAWLRREHVRYESQSTLAEGLATRESYDLPQSLLAEYLDDFVLVDDREIAEGVRFLIEHAHQLAEPAGAAALACARRLRTEIAGASVLLPVTGANISLASLRDIMFTKS